MGIEVCQNYAIAQFVKLSVSCLRDNISIFYKAEEINVKNREFVDTSTLLASSTTVTNKNRPQEFRERVEGAVDLSVKVRFEKKHKKQCTKYKWAHLVKSEAVDDLAEGGSQATKFWYIDYNHATNVIRVQISLLRKKIREGDEGTAQQHVPLPRS